jgi:hypothetical protein
MDLYISMVFQSEPGRLLTPGICLQFLKREEVVSA